MSSFVPPTFGDHGKKVKDLLTKKYAFDRSVVIKSTAANGLKFETQGEATKTGFGGYFKAKYKHGEYGTFEEKVTTGGVIDYSWETSELKPGLTLKLSGNEKPKGTVDVTYKIDGAALTNSVSTDGKATSVKAGAVVGFDGASAGAEVAYDAVAQSLADFNVAAEYTQPDFTVTVKSANQADDVALSYIHSISSALAFGGQFVYSLASGKRSFTAGGEYKLSQNVLVKGKANNEGTVTTMFEHKLQDPEVTFRITSEYDATTYSAAPEKFGLGLIFGEAD